MAREKVYNSMAGLFGNTVTLALCTATRQKLQTWYSIYRACLRAGWEVD